MDPVAAKYIGAGIACIGMGGAGVGVGIIFGNYLAAALRNPSAAQGQFGNLIFGFAITEALGIFSLLMWLVIAFVLLYALMVKLALPRVTSIIESRQKRIDDDIAEAGSLKRQSDEAGAADEKAR